MNDKRIIAVMGATGAQGGGLVRAIHADADSEFKARAITRDTSSDAARELKELGAEVVEADANDLDSLKRAFAGAYGVFGVTFYWQHLSPKTENEQAENIARAAKAAGAQHVVWSTLEDTREYVDDDSMPDLFDEYKVPHFDAKGEVDHVYRDLGVPTTFFRASFYWDNMIHFGLGTPQRGDDGKLSITYPLGSAKMPGIAAADIGKCAMGVFKDPSRFIGETVGIAGEHLNGGEMADSLSRALGEEVRYNEVSPDAFRAFGFPGAEDLGNMFQFYRDCEEYYRGSRDVELSRQLNPELQTLDEWLAENKDRLPIQ